ncbi:hypothetical protein ACMD2_05101 [Ananas comosus]|nr:hypothetical protein ACMD2_05101 [Ananas comosus]
MASPPSWLVLHRPSNPSRFHLLARGDAAQRQQRSAPSWRRLLDRLVREGKKGVCRSMRTSKPLITFGYDAASYAKNFDDSCLADGSRRFRPEDVAGAC